MRYRRSLIGDISYRCHCLPPMLQLADMPICRYAISAIARRKHKSFFMISSLRLCRCDRIIVLRLPHASAVAQLKLYFQHSPLISTVGHSIIPKHFLTWRDSLTAVTRISSSHRGVHQSSSHRGIHQLLLLQFINKQSCLPLNRGIHLKLCLKAPSSWQRDSPNDCFKCSSKTNNHCTAVCANSLQCSPMLMHILCCIFVPSSLLRLPHTVVSTLALLVHFSKTKYSVFSGTITLSQLTNLHWCV